MSPAGQPRKLGPKTVECAKLNEWYEMGFRYLNRSSAWSMAYNLVRYYENVQADVKMRRGKYVVRWRRIS